MMMRVVAVPCRMPGESGRAFIDRMLAEPNNKGRASALPTPPVIDIVEPAKEAPRADSPARLRPDPGRDVRRGDRRSGADPELTNRKRPPALGQRYVGPWPPKWISHRGDGRPKWELLPLTSDQQAWELDQMAKEKARGEAAKPAKK